VTREEFEEQVEEALARLPEEIARMMDNIDVVVADRPTRSELRRVRLPRGELLLGLYTGVPLGERGQHYANVLPDRVVLYQRNIEAAYAPEEIVEGIRQTVLHEVGHHFGLSDERLRELGY
jgi:predicted Zn-dependent protease with MMP-like domain